MSFGKVKRPEVKKYRETELDGNSEKWEKHRRRTGLKWAREQKSDFGGKF